ncbi:MAG: hypothetical protein HOH14_09185 [Gammaproteobacteria bacterium]|jgi:thiol:disulfide interchange protein|nr:hypothetical protein [Gammaproteobacteria bacterium]
MKLLLNSVLSIALAAGVTLCLPAAAQDSLLDSSSTKLPIIRSTVLPADEAFSMNAIIEAPDTLVLYWEIKEGYYLYRKSISASDTHGNSITIGELPTGAVHSDEFFGEVKVYFDRLLHRFPLTSLAMENNKVAFTLQYQGCAEDLYCYPMQKREIELTLPE